MPRPVVQEYTVAVPYCTQHPVYEQHVRTHCYVVNRPVVECYQVPVTRFETRTNYQLVTTNQVSEVLEPVTTMQTSAYFDPCSCGYHNVVTPVTTM